MSTTTSSTSSLLIPKSHQTTRKDYESAFAHLSSQYGFGGSVPSLPRKSTKSTKPSSESQTTKSPVTTTQSTSSSSSSAASASYSSRTQPEKDYQAAFGQLSSSYGFGGGFSVPTRQ
ncbi:hypothetical protein BJ912DRAFT_989212 [Pholiota molesta]|nr:hypothetical protein BJ912DRAFT_989212 [Pholiota molesta]